MPVKMICSKHEGMLEADINRYLGFLERTDELDGAPVVELTPIYNKGELQTIIATITYQKRR